MRFTNDQKTLLLGAGLVVVGVWYLSKKTGQALDRVGQAVNPVSQDNIFNRGVNSLVQALTGEEHATLGTKIYDWTHGG